MPAKRTIRQRDERHPLIQKTGGELEPIGDEGGREKLKRTPRTFYLRPETITAMDTWVRDHWVPGQKRPELSDLVDRAIQQFLTPES